LNLAIVGLGYWGPNLLRNAWELEGVRVKTICDRDTDAMAKQVKRYPELETVTDFDAVLGDPAVDAVLIATRSRPITDWPRRRSRRASTCSWRSRWPAPWPSATT